ncbi:MAG: Gfo/Idh/MocA family oxidoreductase [Anaerolineaceae bacterium]|nr:Gfo/Idh/MocA family oxidoreductase [Anaerolineaceae bacterium]
MKKPIRICMIGAGRVGKNHSRAITRHVPGAKIVALVDPMVEVRQSTALEFGIDQQFDTLEDAIEKVDFEAVVITTPTPTHLALTVLAAENKKHIFLEKPMALNLEECDAIMDVVNKNAVILQLGFMRRFDPEFVAAAQRIEGGEIGQPMMIKSNTHGPGLPPAWACDLRTSNGMLAEVNSHDWDATRWFMGSNYERVYTEVANFKGEAKQVTTPNFYDNVLVNIKFESGGLGMISGVCPCGYGYDARIEIVGEKGIMQIGELKGQSIMVCTNRDQGLITPIVRTWPERFAWAYINELEHFATCVQTETAPKAGGLDGRWAVAGVLAGTKSFLEERPIYLKEIMG